MRTSILAAGLIAATFAGGMARAEELEIPGADHHGPTFQRPAAENPEMAPYMTRTTTAQSPTPPSAPADATAQPKR